MIILPPSFVLGMFGIEPHHSPFPDNWTDFALGTAAALVLIAAVVAGVIWVAS